MKRLIPVLLLLALIIACDANSIAETYTVRFDSNGGTEIRDQVIKKGNMATEPKDPIKAGTAGFKAWTLDGAAYDFSTPVTKDILLVATYTEIYSVSFDSGKGSQVPMQNVIEGEKAIEPKDPTLTGYTFVSWTTLDGKAYNFNTPVTDNILLFANYSKNGETHKVRFWSMGGESYLDQVVADGERASFPGMPENSSKWGFRAWAIRSGDDEPYTYEEFDFKTPIRQDLELHAWYWEKYTVSFDTDGGSKVSSQELKEGTRAVEPSAPTKENVIFKEWQLDGEKYDFNKAVNSSITLKAAYDAVYTVTFDSDGGTAISAQSVKTGEYALAPANPEKANTKGFKYWSYTNASGKSEIFDFSKPITSNITLKANYWPDMNNQSGETYKDIEDLKNEVANIFHIIEDLRKTDGVMNGKTNIEEAFTIVSGKCDTILDVFARLGFNPKSIWDKDGNEYKIGDVNNFYYEIKTDASKLNRNSSKKETVNSTLGINKYELALEGLELTLYLHVSSEPQYSATLTRKFDIAATVFDYGSGQVEISANFKIDDKEYPMLYAIYEKNVTHGSYSESHLYFTYKGYTGQVLPDNYNN